MNPINELTEMDFTQAIEDLKKIESTLETAIVGQNELISQILISFISAGHILIEGLPGLGKTHLAKALAATLDLGFSRVQCTPDLMPSDITGSEMLLNSKHGDQQFKFQPGPIFSPIVLVDEINRATPKTQAALLEAMQEQQVTYTGTSHPLPYPFWIIATQNPIEIEGTYPLPEAQLDRFLVKLKVEFPTQQALLSMLDISLDSEPSELINPIINKHRLEKIMHLSRKILISDRIKQAAVQLILSTHPEHSSDSHLFRYGASPRGLQSLVRTARTRALINGRLQVDLDDLQAMALPSLRHRVLLSIESELDGVDSDELLGQIIFNWRKNI